MGMLIKTHLTPDKFGLGKKNTAFIKVAFVLGLLTFGSPSYAEEKYFSDNSISYRYGVAFKEPSVARGNDIIKNILNFKHINTDKFGSNFLNIDLLLSHDNDKAKNSAEGAKEIYLIYRRDWSMHKITGADFSKLGIINDISLHMGGDINTKNTAFEPRKKLIVIGPQLHFAVPVGYFNMAFDYSKEWNHNGIVNRNVTFDPAFELEATWGIPFKIKETSWKFSGFFTYVAPKGRDGFGRQTKAEILTRPEIMLDVGELIGKKKNFLEMGLGYEYWLNKFGNDHERVRGSFAKTPMIIARMHF